MLSYGGQAVEWWAIAVQGHGNDEGCTGIRWSTKQLRPYTINENYSGRQMSQLNKYEINKAEWHSRKKKKSTIFVVLLWELCGLLAATEVINGYELLPFFGKFRNRRAFWDKRLSGCTACSGLIKLKNNLKFGLIFQYCFIVSKLSKMLWNGASAERYIVLSFHGFP